MFSLDLLSSSGFLQGIGFDSYLNLASVSDGGQHVNLWLQHIFHSSNFGLKF
jgi:hypothetical protein